MRQGRFPFILALLLALAAAPAFQGRAAGVPASLQYAILSSRSVPQNGFDSFLADYLLLGKGTLRVTLAKEEADGAPLRQWSIQQSDGKPHIFRWDGKVSGRLLAPGHYRLIFQAEGDSALPLDFAVVPPRAALPLLVTGEGLFLPVRADEGAVWQALMAPVAVVDGGDLQHHALWDRPGRGARKVGEVHGETAGLQVLALEAEGWARVGAFATEDGAWVEGYIEARRLKMVQPDSRFGLLIDKNAQTLSVYRDGRMMGTLPVSTGLMARGKLFRQTRAGAFLTQDRQLGFDSEGFRYDYAIRIDGGNMIHQVGYQLVGGAKDFSAQLPELLRKASHGCVRVDPALSPEGLNMLWLWTHLPRGIKVLVLDDPAARLMELAALGQAAAPAAEPAASLPPSPSPSPAPPREASLTLTFMGDSVIGSEEASRPLPASFHSVIARRGAAWPFLQVQDLLAKDDLSILNFEGVLKDSASGKQARQHNFRGPAAFADILRQGSVELAGLANNHFDDYGQAGRTSTRAALQAAGIPFFGYGTLCTRDQNGIRLGFGGIRETTYKQDKGRIAREIAELEARGANYIVYTCHFGTEYETGHNPLQTQMAHAAIDAGADLVVGAHPHVVQGIERYKGGLILYSLGNFVFGGNLHLSTFDGLMAQVTLAFRDQHLQETRLRLIPVLTSGTRPANNFQPLPAGGADKARILTAIQADSGDLAVEEVLVFR
ncbi:MAG: CapA family protein [Christensenellales bacterium]